MLESLLRRLAGTGTVTTTLLIALLVALPPASVSASVSASAGLRTVLTNARTGPGAPVVLLGTGGLRWEDVGSSTPALYAAVEQDAAGSLAVRSVRDETCPVDGWLAVSAGRRAADQTPEDLAGTAPRSPDRTTDAVGCRIPSGKVSAPGGTGTSAGWTDYRTQAAAGRFDAEPGLLGSVLEAAHVKRAAVGPGALIATADRQGHTPAAWPGLPTGPEGTIDLGGDAVGLAGQVRAAVASGARLVAVDLGAVREAGTPSGNATGPASRDEQVAALDTRLGLVLGAVPPDSTVIVASLADDGSRPHLQVVLAGGHGFGPGLLRANSTRQDGLVQSTDLLPTIVAALGLPAPAGVVGAPFTRVGGGDPLARLQHGLDLDQASLAVERLVTPFFVGYGVVGLLVLSTLGLLAVRGRAVPLLRRRALIGLQITGVALSLVPVATFTANLWPWWRFPAPGLQVTAAVAVVAAPLTGLALAGPWRRALLGPAAVAGALTVAVLTADLAAGSPLELAALIGGQPIIAGRFYGLSNPTFALLATGALIAALGLAELLLSRGRPRRQAALAVAAVGVAATVIDGIPSLGSDFGGPPALVPAFGLLALRVAGIRVTWQRLTAIGGATVGALLSVALADWLRPVDQRTHLGRFVQSTLDGDGALIIQRKAEQNLGLLLSTPLTLSVPVAAAVAAALLWQPTRWRLTALRRAYDRQPLLPAGLAALGVLLALGFLANDSGTSIPPASLMILAPLLVTITARTAQLDDLDDTEHLERAIRAAQRQGKR